MGEKVRFKKRLTFLNIQEHSVQHRKV